MASNNIALPGYIFTLTLSVSPVFACEPDEISSRIKQPQAFEFVQEKHISALSRPLISTGRLSMNDNNELIWELLSPVASTLMISPAGIRQYNAEGELTMSNTSGQFTELSSLFLSVFSGDMESLQKSFSVSANCGADQEWTLTMQPDNQSLAKILAQVQISGSESLDTITYEEKRGDMTTIYLTPVSGSTRLDSLE
jgi:hypothetical protein